MDAGHKDTSRLWPARYAGRRLIALIGLLLVAFWALDLGLLASPGRAQERRPAKAGRRPVSDRQFTIAKIEPMPGRKRSKFFSASRSRWTGLRGNLRLLPLVKIDWRQVSHESGRPTHPQGHFKYGLGYVVNLPENFSLAGLTYVPTVTSFFMPDRPPKLEYVEQQKSHRAG